MQWNEGQAKAIYTCWLDSLKTKRSNLLVNAAAGSGKTAVLVERIIQKILPDESGVCDTDIDRLLVVTFTKAAAAEMEQKINKAIVQQIIQSKGDPIRCDALTRQLNLLGCADICNIDSYCVRVVRNHFHILGIDPNFSPASNGEIALLEEEALSKLFEELYESDSEFAQEFNRIVMVYSGNTGDDGLYDIIKTIYRFTTSLPDPILWLDTAVEKMKNGLDDNALSIILDKINAILDHAVSQLQKAICIVLHDTLNISDAESNMDFYLSEYPIQQEHPITMRWGEVWTNLYHDFSAVCALKDMDWDMLYSTLETVKFSIYPMKCQTIKFICNGKKFDSTARLDNDTLLSEVLNLKNAAKDAVSELKVIVSSTLEEQTKIMQEYLYPDIKTICTLVKQFIKKFDTLKARRNILEFSDIERLTYRLFAEHADIREEYIHKYDEILIDEYQDVNALQEAIFSSISTGTNMFMVGDMKQSIYHFRNADPSIFKHKLDTFRDAENKVITLNANYRSRSSVLDSVNTVFEKIMSQQSCEMDYDEQQRLNTGDKNYAPVNLCCNGDVSELCLIRAVLPDTDTIDEIQENITKTALEARFVAEKIKELKDSHYQIRYETKDQNGQSVYAYRDIKNSDIAILSDSVRSISDCYLEELSKRDIACYVENTGYFGRKEVTVILSLIKIINNPLCDIPLIAVLRSSIFGFTEDELAQIRITKSGRFIHAVTYVSKTDHMLSEKCISFLKQLSRWRGYTKYMSSDKLIWTLYEETDFYSYAGTWPDGEEAQANLRLLFERAKAYENTGFKGLFHFIRYIDKLKAQSNDLSTAKLISEKHDVVKMMTMHKSKGLEFPVVFIVNAVKQFRNDSKQSVITMHKDMGFGMKYINYEERYSLSTLISESVGEKNHNEYLAERMRLLYVAMTRAKEKLFVTGVLPASMKHPADKWSGTVLHNNAGDNAAYIQKCKSFVDWLAPIACRSSEWNYQIIEYNGTTEPSCPSSEAAIKKGTPDSICIDDILNYQYSYQRCIGIPAKISVTTVKNEWQKKNEDVKELLPSPISIIKRPQFMQEKAALTPAQKGTVVHYVMQSIDDTACTNISVERILSHIETLVQKGFLSQKEANCVDVKKLFAFYQTPLGKRIERSTAVYKECPFEILMPVSELYPELDTAYANEEIMLQGIIDCYFEENDGIVLVDYKTDSYRQTAHAIEKIKSKYIIQLNLYAHAIEKITEKPVKEKYLYLFSHNDVVKC